MKNLTWLDWIFFLCWLIVVWLDIRKEKRRSKLTCFCGHTLDKHGPQKAAGCAIVNTTGEDAMNNFHEQLAGCLETDLGWLEVGYDLRVRRRSLIIENSERSFIVNGLYEHEILLLWPLSKHDDANHIIAVKEATLKDAPRLKLGDGKTTVNLRLKHFADGCAKGIVHPVEPLITYVQERMQ